jgi:hypothetical protein
MHLTIDRENFAALEARFFLLYADPSHSIDQWKDEVDRDGLLEACSAGRSYYLDAETLAEGAADIALKDLERVLAMNGVAIGNPTVEYDPLKDETILRVDGKCWPLCAHPFSSLDSWADFSRGFFSMVNGLLASVGSQERLYAFRPYANDQMGIFLTPPLFETLADTGLAARLERIDVPSF